MITFDLFVNNYQMKEEELEKISKFLPSNKLRSMEFPLKVSNNTIVPNHGLGRVVLTQKWLVHSSIIFTKKYFFNFNVQLEH